MLRNYLKIAWRSLWKHKLFSLINILGLSIAIPSALMSLIQIVGYYEYDNFHNDREQIIRVITDQKLKDGHVTNWASTPVQLGGYIKENLAGVDRVTTIVRDNKWVLSSGLKTKNVNAIYTDTSFFRIFNFPLEKGAYPVEPHSIVLTHETAQWFFRDANPIGSALDHPKYGSFKVVGVLKPFNEQKTQFRTNIMVAMGSYEANNPGIQNWLDLKAHTFLKVSKGKALSDLNKQLSGTSSAINKLSGKGVDSLLYFKAQTLAEVSPSKIALENDPYIQDVRSIYINFAFQLIIIILAALNYINLTLARSMSRGREVGVRKVMGATKPQLVFQFLTESVLISYISLAGGLLLLWFIKTNMHVSWLSWDIDNLGYLILLFFVFNLVLGLAAGVSPSLILSSYQPVKVLKGNVLPATFGRIGFRKSMIIFQFIVALVYVFFVGHSFHQINYMATDNENFQREDILNISLSGNKNKLFANDIQAIKEVQAVGYTSLSFGNKPVYSTIKKSKNEASRPAFYYATDHNFIENMGLKMVAGKNLIESTNESASSMIVVNQKAVENLRMGTVKDAIGKQMIVNDTLLATIIGVVADFCNYNYESKVEPMVFQYQPSLFKVMCLKTNAIEDRKVLEAGIEKVWKKHNPYLELNASWLDTDMYERYYPLEDMKFMGMEGVAILVIAILGLVGILIYSLEKRVKEIGIRKVMGANVSEVIKLMSKDFIKLLVIATVIAVPFGIAVGYFMNTYLVFNNGIGYMAMFVLLTLVLGIALGIVGYFSWKVAQTNPAKTLRAD